MKSNPSIIARDARELLYATGKANIAAGASIGASAGSLIPIPVVGTAIGTAAGAVIGALINPTKQLIKNIRKDSDKLFLADRDDIDKMLSKGGYKRPDSGGRSDAPSFTEFKIKADQVSGKSDRYDYAYERLQKFLVKIFNTYQPGLGDLYAPQNPVYMRSANNVAHEWVDYIKAFIETYPAGSVQARLLVSSTREQEAAELKAQGATNEEIEAITGVKPGLPKAATAGISIVVVVVFILIVVGMMLKR
jgi:hypothetical protein